MQPLGRKKTRFPNKTNEWLGKRIKMWWEDMVPPNKKASRQNNTREIECSLSEFCMHDIECSLSDIKVNINVEKT